MNIQYALSIALMLSSTAAQAQTAVADPEARTHFQTALHSAEQGDLAIALSEFERAYAIRPHFSVLYNIGQVRSTLGRPVEAVAAFEQYLADGGKQVPESRRKEVEALLESNRIRIGQVRITSEAGGATRVWLDGVELKAKQLEAPIPVAGGEHSVVAASGSSFLDARVISVTPGETAALHFGAPPRPVAGGVAQLVVPCDVPGMDVEIDGALRGRTPVSVPLLIPPGPIRLRFSRPGYQSTSRSLTTLPGDVVAAPCAARAMIPLTPELAVPLVVRTNPSDANVTVDAQPFHGERLPLGVHELRIERDGYHSVSRTVALKPGRPGVYEVTLQPNAATQERHRHVRERHRAWGFAFASGGVALLGSGIGVYTWNSGRYSEWAASRDQSAAATSSRRVASIQRADDTSFGLIALGAGLTLAGSWLLLVATD